MPSENGIVETDLGCIRCGYNLRMLKENGKCPECGTTVSRTVQSPYAKVGREQLTRVWRSAAALSILNVCGIVMGLMVVGEAIWEPALVGGMALMLVLLHGGVVWYMTQQTVKSYQREMKTRIRRASIFLVTAVIFLLFAADTHRGNLDLILASIGGVLSFSAVSISNSLGEWFEDCCLRARMISLGDAVARSATALAVALAISISCMLAAVLAGIVFESAVGTCFLVLLVPAGFGGCVAFLIFTVHCTAIAVRLHGLEKNLAAGNFPM